MILAVVMAIVLLRRAWVRPAEQRKTADSDRVMGREEALKVLGVTEEASEAEILGSYRELMKKMHPDHPGGSSYFASKLNQARDVLLGYSRGRR